MAICKINEHYAKACSAARQKREIPKISPLLDYLRIKHIAGFPTRILSRCANGTVITAILYSLFPLRINSILSLFIISTSNFHGINFRNRAVQSFSLTTCFANSYSSYHFIPSMDQRFNYAQHPLKN